MYSRFAIFFPLALVAACSSTSSGNSSTSTVSPKTIAGVCAKLDSLSCAQPNCVDKMTLIQSNCSSRASDFQALVDCMSVASIACGGNPNIPRTAECQANVDSLSSCASGASSGPGQSDGNSSADAGTAGGSSGTCSSVTDCTSWPCTCADGSSVNISSCTNGVCADSIAACGSNSQLLIDACSPHH